MNHVCFKLIMEIGFPLQVIGLNVGISPVHTKNISVNPGKSLGKIFPHDGKEGCGRYFFPLPPSLSFCHVRICSLKLWTPSHDHKGNIKESLEIWTQRAEMAELSNESALESPLCSSCCMRK